MEKGEEALFFLIDIGDGLEVRQFADESLYYHRLGFLRLNLSSLPVFESQRRDHGEDDQYCIEAQECRQFWVSKKLEH